MPEQEEGATNTGGPQGVEPDNTVTLRQGELANAEYDSDAGYTFTTCDGREYRGIGNVTFRDVGGGEATYTFVPGEFVVRPARGITTPRVDATFVDAVPRYMPRYTTTCDCSLCRPAPLTPTELAAERMRYERERQERLQRRQAAEVARLQAEERAQETLRSILRPDELAEYERTSRLCVTGSDGKRYQFDAGIVYNVHLLNDAGDIVADLCCHPDLYPVYSRDGLPLPYGDVHLAQVLWLRHDLENFWNTANISWHDSDARREFERRQNRRWTARRRLERIRRLGTPA